MARGGVKALLSNQQRMIAASAVALAVVGLGAIAVIEPGKDKPASPPDSCDVLRADAVGNVLGTPPGRVVAVPRPPDPEGDRCNYEDKDTRKLVFFVRVEETKDRAQALQLAQSLTGTPVPGVGEVARFDQTPARSQMTTFAGRRWLFMTSVAAAVPQDRMATLARQAIARGSRLPRT
jgi:hypothetical protein